MKSADKQKKKKKKKRERERGKKRESGSKLKVFRSTRSDEDRKEYAEARKRYRYLLKAKKLSFRREKTTLLASAANLNNPIKVLERIEKYGLRETEQSQQ